jgi:hypothetical protein
MRTALLLTLVSSLLLGCAAAKLGPLDPKPKIRVDKQEATLTLSIDAEVPDRFTVPAAGGVRKVRVRGWHETLTRGFENGLTKVYALQPPDAEHDLQLVFTSAELSFVPSTSVVTEGATPAKAKLTYRVRILDGAGNSLAASAGELTSRRIWSTSAELVDAVEEVVVAMIVDVSYALVTKTSPAPEEEHPMEEAP